MVNAGEQPEQSRTEHEVLQRVTPKEGLSHATKEAIAHIEHALVHAKIPARVQLGGSVAKGTNLAGDHDVDVFVRFSRDADSNTLSDVLEPVLRKTFSGVERVHGSRDYFHIAVSDGTLEVVPVLDVATWQEAANVTDMSPLHVAYVRAHVEQRPWLAQEIRLTKQFMKSAKVYGAESYLGGFSGHVVDLLVISYGSFHALLEAASREWSRKIVLDPQGALADPLAQLNASKTHAPLVIVDPVQQDRNSAAALTKVCFDRFRDRAKEYVHAKDSEQKQFFTIEPLSIEDFVARHPGARVLCAMLTPMDGKKDVVGAKCAKVHEHVMRMLGENGFELIDHTWEFTRERATLLYALAPENLGPEIDVVGPPVHMTDAVIAFQQVHSTTFTHDGRLHAVEPRQYRDALDLLKIALNNTYARERVKESTATQVEQRRGA